MSDRPFLNRKRADHNGSDTSGATPKADDANGLGSARIVPSGFTDPAVVGVVIATTAYLEVFLGATDIVGGTGRTAVAVVAAGLCGAIFARSIGERTALKLTAVLFVATLAGYFFTIPASQRAVFSLRSVVFDIVSLLTGLSIIRLALADVWILAVAPVPTFLVAYLAGRGRHVSAATIAGGILWFLVLTGDAGEVATLAGVVGVALTAGLSTLSTPGSLRDHGDTLAAVLAAMILVSATVTVLPTGAAQPWALDRGNPDLESTLGSDDEVQIVGPTQLSPEVRYTIESPVASNWHTGSYDTYTGDGWVRSGEQSPFEEPLDGPPGETTNVNVSVTAETETRSLPAPWQAVDVRGAGDGTVEVDERGTLRLGTPLQPGDETTVESRVIGPEPVELRNASEEYDPEIEDRYTQLPASTPDRLGERTDAIVSSAGAENSYDKAVVIEQYLIENYDYSLTVERPDGDIADAFLFEMDAGYCVYFATTMVAMLRSQGVPARFTTGYTTGEQVSEDRYVVRGQNAHAWVTVYFPEHGWVEFDPTPSDERDQVRTTRLAEARADGVENVDTEESEIDTTLNVDPTAATEAPGLGTDSSADTNGTDEAENGTGDGDIPSVQPSVTDGEGAVPRAELEAGTAAEDPAATASEENSPIPSGDAVAYWVFVVAVVVAGARHLGATGRVRRTGRLWLPWSRGSPAEDAKRAFAEAEHLLARRYRERRPGETPRAYLEALRLRGVDERVLAVGEAYERATYAGTVTREEADEARRTVRRLALEGTPVLGRLIDRK